MEDALLIAAGYVLGSMPFGYWLPRALRGTDIRTVGSGNVGASNVWRTFGWRLGLPVLALDVAKGAAAALLGLLLAGEVVGVLAGSAAIVGHWRPLFLGLTRGGKVVATTGGVVIALAPLAGLCCGGRLAPRLSRLPLRVTGVNRRRSLSAAVRAAVRCVLGGSRFHDRCRSRDRRPPSSESPAPRSRGGTEGDAAPQTSLCSQSSSPLKRAVRVPLASSSRSSPTVPNRSASTSCAWIVSKLTCRACTKSPSASSAS